MATLFVTEYASLGADVAASVAPIAAEPAVTTQTVSFTTTTQSSAFNASTRFVRLIADADCHLLFGANPSATTSHQKVMADTVEWRAVQPGDKVAAVTAS